MKSSKHAKGKERMSNLLKKEARERDLAETLQKSNDDVHLRGETLPQTQQVFRVKVLKSFLQAGIPLNKIGPLGDLLEEGGYRLCDRRFLYDLIPFVVKEEEMQIKDEIKNKHVGVIFDGTTHTCEALAIILRFISDSFTIEQKLVRIQLLAKSLTGEEITRELTSVLSTSLGITSQFVVATMRDRVSCEQRCHTHNENNIPEFSGHWMFFTHSGPSG